MHTAACTLCWCAVTQETKSVPISVQEIVAARIDTLDSGLALVLKVHYYPDRYADSCIDGHSDTQN
jgi:hypothetical protein